MAKRKKTTDRQFAIAAAKIAQERHCTDVIILDLRRISPATNFFVIATGTSDRQSRAVADEIFALARQSGIQRFGQAGYEHGHWILMDFIDIVIHIFDQQHRQYYQLEMLWGDAKKISTASAAAAARTRKT